MPFCLVGTFEDQTGQKDRKDGVGVDLAHEVGGLPDDAQMLVVQTQQNSRDQEERVVRHLRR